VVKIFDDIMRPVPSGARLPYLTALRVSQYSSETQWPADAFPQLQSLHLEIFKDALPVQAVNIPGSSSITELTMSPYSFWEPDAARVQAMALALPQLRKLQLVVTGHYGRDGEQCVVPWMQALSAFTQLQELAIKVEHCRYNCSCHSRVPPEQLLLPEDVLFALCKLPQLHCLTLSGWAWNVSPLFVAALGPVLTQLSSIRFEGCDGCRGEGPAHEAYAAAIRQRMVRAAARVRAGLLVEYVK
jgi:hypothetical protein